MNALEAIKAAGTLVVADSGEIDKIKIFKPEDSTTNPSLVNAAARLPEYRHLVDDAIAYAVARSTGDDVMEVLIDKVMVNFGVELLKHVPGVVSTEVDARTSFSVPESLRRARRIIAMFAEAGVPKQRVLIKLASSWEGIRAAEVLQKEGVNCNLTLLFSFAQAVACADAGAFLISPFVGRVLDWFAAKNPGTNYAGAADPGVQAVTRIYRYYKAHGIKTVVMGASFRNTGEITELAGCDRLTIAPKLLEELTKMDGAAVQRKLSPDGAAGAAEPAVHYDEAGFRFALNEDAMASDKLSEGIRNFAADLRKLEDFLKPLLAAAQQKAA